jgi:hopanoid biosynthesis associated protein HpnK
MAGTPPPGDEHPPRPRFLIVNGDDFGLTAGINAGIERACRDGILRSASAMVVGPALADAAERVHRLPGLGVGLHLTLVGERPACPPEEVPSLVGRDGRLLPDYRTFLWRYLRGAIRSGDARRECRAQAAAVAALGAPLDHLDSHQHLHLLPGLMVCALEVAREHGIRWIRAPRPLKAGDRRQTTDDRTRSAAVGPDGFTAAPPSPRSLVERVMFQAASTWARRRLARLGLPLAEGSLGFDCSGRLTPDYLLRHIPTLPLGMTELICHPGEEDPETQARYRKWDYHWKQELDALTDPAVRNALVEADVRLTTFGAQPVSPARPGAQPPAYTSKPR